jgi:hypothetical protein
VGWVGVEPIRRRCWTFFSTAALLRAEAYRDSIGLEWRNGTRWPGVMFLVVFAKVRMELGDIKEEDFFLLFASLKG